jgi:ABC-type Fe3+ transport system permease subunit
VPPPPAANPFAFDDVADDAPRGDRRRSDSGDRRRNVPNNMVWAVLSTLFCCLPLGLVAILQAAKVNGLARQGKYREAQKAANSAKTLSMAGAVASVVVWVASVGVGVAMAYLAPQQPPDGKPQFNFNPKGQEGRPPAR